MNRVCNRAQQETDDDSQHSAFAPIGFVRPALRGAVMKTLLIDLRDKELEKIRALVHDETMLAGQAPADELDQARSDGDLEFQVSLLDLSERRLAAITSTLARLEEGRFGICEECSGPISLARLRSMPFARNCFDCQKRMEAPSSGASSRVFPSSSATDLFDSHQPKAERFDKAAEPVEEIAVPRVRRRGR